MKKCEHVKEMILTDYIDGQIDQAASVMMEGHLLDCMECREFFKDVKTTLKAFKAVPREAVPEALWSSIKENLEYKASPWEAFLENLKSWAKLPKLVPVFASLMVMMTIGSMSFNMYHVRLIQEKEQGEYLVSLLGSGASATENNDPGTPIEHYFL